MNNEKNHERLFPEDEQAAEEMAKLVDEGIVLQLINSHPGMTMRWGKQVRLAYSITDEIEQFLEARIFGVKPTSYYEVDKEDEYDINKRMDKRDKEQQSLVNATLTLNKIAISSGLAPVLPRADSMSNDDVIRHIFAYYEARIKRKGIGRYESHKRRNVG